MDEVRQWGVRERTLRHRVRRCLKVKRAPGSAVLRVSGSGAAPSARGGRARPRPPPRPLRPVRERVAGAGRPGGAACDAAPPRRRPHRRFSIMAQGATRTSSSPALAVRRGFAVALGVAAAAAVAVALGVAAVGSRGPSSLSPAGVVVGRADPPSLSPAGVVVAVRTLLPLPAGERAGVRGFTAASRGRRPVPLPTPRRPRPRSDRRDAPASSRQRRRPGFGASP